MNKRNIIMLAIVLLAGAAGYGLALWRVADGMAMPGPSTAQRDAAGQENEILYWVAPMDANYRRDGPGKSPMGMDLVPVYKSDAAAQPHAATVQIDSQIARNLGLRTSTVRRANFARKIQTVGYTAWDETGIRILHPRAEGWLEEFNIASVGDNVRKGDVVYELYAPKLVSAQQEYLGARRSGNPGLIRAARSRLLALGVSESQVTELERRGRADERLAWRAEHDAVVIAVAARSGSFVTPMTAIATLADPAAIWVDVEVVQSQAGWIEPRQAATASVSAWPGEVWQGTVAHVYPELDAATRTQRLRLRFANPGLRLKPNMFARVSINATPRDNVLLVPREAVILAEAGARVVQALGDGRFAVRAVRTGLSDAAQIEIVDGLEAGTEVVTSGQFLIDAEANGAQALERLNALRRVAAQGRIAGFPRRGALRINHDPVAELEWPAMNMVFEVAPGTNLMPFNKRDRIAFSLQETLNGDWIVSDLQSLEVAAESAP